MTDKRNTTSSGAEIETVSLTDIAFRFEQLGHDLENASKSLRVRPARQLQLDAMEAQGVDFSDLPEDGVAFARERAEDLRRALLALGSFRREYSRWERLLTEYALTRENLTQRDAAKLLGVGLSTVNRWAQHPLRVEDKD